MIMICISDQGFILIYLHFSILWFQIFEEIKEEKNQKLKQPKDRKMQMNQNETLVTNANHYHVQSSSDCDDN